MPVCGRQQYYFLRLVACLLTLSRTEEPTKLKFGVTPLTEEQQSSKVMPEEFKCDACKAVVFQIDVALQRAKPVRRRALLESEGGKRALQDQAIRVTSALEEACHSKTYSDYGLKEGIKDDGNDDPVARRLHGPGIEVKSPGVIQGGGPWAARLRARCASLVEDADEEPGALVEHWLDGTLPNLCESDCGAKGRREQRRVRRRPQSRDSGTPARGGKTVAPASVVRTGLEELPPPPYVCVPITRHNASKIIDGPTGKRPQKFRIVLFHDEYEKSAHVVAILELAVRKLRKARESALRKLVCARYYSTDGDTFGYNFVKKGGVLPKLLLFRRGYRNPKIYSDSMMGPDDFVDWMRNEVVNVYMKDDPAEFPRAEEL